MSGSGPGVGTGDWSRRRFLAGLAATAAAATTAMACSSDDSATPSSSTTGGTTTDGEPTTTATTAPLPDLPAGLFALGVASGDPLPDSVILWTRLAPSPMQGGGMPGDDVPVRWEVATDPGFSDVVAQGVAAAVADLAHSVHVDASGLRPDTPYHYRFTVGEQVSPVGRTRTAPAADQEPDSLRLVFASCQNWTDGLWPAWRHAADEEPHLVVFLGDYIYESGEGVDTDVRLHNSPEIITLDDYRNRYGLYKGDADLQAAHAVAPWVVTWDDHEVENNYAGPTPQNPADAGIFEDRRAAAYQAFYEHHPVRVDPPEGSDLVLYRTLDWGTLARIHVLDGRQYRSDQPCDTGFDFGAPCDEVEAPDATMLGREQEEWLGEQVASSEAVWDLFANQVIMTRSPLAGGAIFNLDQWDGYPAARERFLAQVVQAERPNPVVFTGDIHASAVGDVRRADGGPIVAAEFVGTSISSQFPRELAGAAAEVFGSVPDMQWFEAGGHGYVSCEITPGSLTARYQVVDSVTDPKAGVSTSRTWVVEAGTPGAAPA